MKCMEQFLLGLKAAHQAPQADQAWLEGAK